MAELAAATVPRGVGPQAMMGEEGSVGDRAGPGPKEAMGEGGSQWPAGGCYMMEQADSGFRTWQVQAAPQYCLKVW